MKSFSTLAISAVAAAAAFSSVVSAIKIDTPMSVVACQPVQLSWHEGSTTGFVYISAVPGMDITAAPLVSFAPQPAAVSGTLTWPQVNITAGTTFTLVVNDAVGQPNYSSQVTVQAGNSQCSAVAGAAGGSGSTRPSSGSATTSSSAPAGSAPATTKASTGVSSTKPSSSAPSSGTTGSSTMSSAASSVSVASPLLAAAVLLASVAMSASLL